LRTHRLCTFFPQTEYLTYLRNHSAQPSPFGMAVSMSLIQVYTPMSRQEERNPLFSVIIRALIVA
jgi:hypothetical protein